MKPLASARLLTLSLLASSAAAGQGMQTSHHQTYGVCDGPVIDPSCRVHDPPPMPEDDSPLYLRGALGAAWHRSHLRVAPVSGPDREADIDAPALGLTAAVGVAFDYGVNLGIELGVQTGFSPRVTSEVGGFDQYQLSSLFSATGMVIVDWYFDPNDDSFHLQGGVGLGGTSYDAKQAGKDFEILPTGWAGQLGIGYEFGVSRHLDWSYGLLLRLDAGYYAMADAKAIPDRAAPRATFVAPGLYATVTLN